jgi:hypothetical protein
MSMPETLSASVRSLVSDLLIVDEERRFGSAAHGGELEQLQAHPCLCLLDWAAIERKECTPPFPPCGDADAPS